MESSPIRFADRQSIEPVDPVIDSSAFPSIFGSILHADPGRSQTRKVPLKATLRCSLRYNPFVHDAFYQSFHRDAGLHPVNRATTRDSRQ